MTILLNLRNPRHRAISLAMLPSLVAATITLHFYCSAGADDKEVVYGYSIFQGLSHGISVELLAPQGRVQMLQPVLLIYVNKPSSTLFLMFQVCICVPSFLIFVRQHYEVIVLTFNDSMDRSKKLKMIWSVYGNKWLVLAMKVVTSTSYTSFSSHQSGSSIF